MHTTTTVVSYGYNPVYPEAYITKGKNRLRQNGNSVYLKNNDEFEIELFNPTTVKVLAKIKINGTYISERGLVIKPGQRFHLDRYIDIAKRFAFGTYDVESGNSAVDKAIANNGDVQIEFFDEITHINFNSNLYPKVSYYCDPNPPIMWDSTKFGSTCYTSSQTFNSSSKMHRGLSKTSLNEPTLDCLRSAPQPQALKETGRVEEGGYSNTKFGSDSSDFNTYSSHSVFWKIIPESQAPVEVGDVRQYCPHCQFRIRKSNWKFCPNCSGSLN